MSPVPTPPTRVLVYEDNPDLRASLCHLLSHSTGVVLAGAFGNCLEAQANVAALHPDVILMDIDMPGMTGIEGLRRIKATTPNVNVVMLTVFEENDHVFEAICAGADGYLLKKTAPQKLLDAVLEVGQGGAPMTPAIARQVLRLFPRPSAKPVPEESLATLSAREQNVLSLLVQGYSYKMIAADLEISIDTVRSHIKKIYNKLHVRSSTEAVGKAMRYGLA